MTHLSITAPGDSRADAEWGDHVTDDDHRRR